MVRKLAWLVVVLLIVADVVLIATVSRTSGPAQKPRASAAAGVGTAFPAPEMVAPTRSGRAPSTAGPGSVPGPGLVAPPGPLAGPGPAASLRPTPSTSTAVSTEAPGSGQITVLGESRDLDAPPETTAARPAPGESGRGDSSSGDSSSGESGGVLLAIGADGTILRAARGACPSPVAAALGLSRDFGASWTPVPALVAQVLGVGAARPGVLWFVGTDAACRPAALESADRGGTWERGSVAGTWYLNPDRDSTDVVSPRLLADVGCVPTALAGIDARRAAAMCTHGDIRVTDDFGESWTTASSIPGAVSLAFVSADRGYALAGTGACPAAVLRTVDGARTWTQLACLGDAAPLAIAATSGTFASTAGGSAAGRAADTVLAQVGSDLHVSRDGGRTWRTTGG